MFTSRILTSVFRRHDHYYHNYEGGIEVKRFYLFPFAHKGSSNTLSQLPFSKKYIFLNELAVITIIIASTVSCALLGLDFSSWWPALLLNIISLAALGTRGLMSYGLLRGGTPVNGVVIGVSEFENAGGEKKELCFIRSLDGSEYELNDLVPGAYSVGDKVLLLSSNEGPGISIHRGQAMVEVGIYSILYVGSCWFIACALGCPF